MAYLLGIDLGTTFTAAAIASGTGSEPAMVGLGNRALQVPSVLFLTEEPAGAFVVGEAAERRGLVEPARVVREFKRRLGDQVPVLVNGSPFSADALMAQLLSWVVAQVAQRTGGAPAGVVLTHPASWGPFKLEAFRQVAHLADVPPTQWVPEPVAAAAQYAARAKITDGDRLAVYDLGGGTLDVCVLEKTPAGFAMLGPAEGVEHLGGADFDEALFQLVLRGLGDRLTQLDSDDPQVTTGLARLRRDCVEAKEALSAEVEVAVPVALPGIATSVRVTRGEFEALIRPTLQHSVEALTRALRAATVTADELAGIVLVGGSSRIPLVGELLQREFNVNIAIDTHPKHDIALGAVRLVQDQRMAGGGAADAEPAETSPVPLPITRPTPRPTAPATASPEPAAAAGPAAAATLPAWPPVRSAPQQPPPPAASPLVQESSPQAASPPVQESAPPPRVQPPGGSASRPPTQAAAQSPARPEERPVAQAGPPIAPPPPMPSTSAAAATQPVAPSRPAPTPPTPPTRAPATAGTGPPRRPSRRVLIISGVALTAVVAGTAVGIAFSRSGQPSAGPTLAPVSTVSALASTGPTPTVPASTGPTPTGSPTRTLAALPQSRALTDSEMIVPMQVNGRWNLYLGNTGSAKPGRKLTKESGDNSFPSLSPDLTTVIYPHVPADGGPRTLRVAGAADGQGDRPLFSRQPSQCARFISRPAWNPADPTMLAMPCIDGSGRMGVYEFRTDGTLIRKIDTGDNTTFGDPTISSDGKTLVFWASPNNKFDGGTLVAAPTDGSAPARRLVANTMPGQDADPVFSPDGASLAFRRRAGTAADRKDLNIWVVSTAPGSKPRQLTRDKADEQDPSFSRSGDQLAYKSGEPSDDFSGAAVPRIRLMNVDGAGDSRVLWTSSGAKEQTAAAWSRR